MQIQPKKLYAALLTYAIIISPAIAKTIEYSPCSYENVVADKVEYEKEQDKNPFSLTAYEPNYILPINYTTSQSPIYWHRTPDNQKIQKIDFKFQFSLKTPVWRNFLGQSNVLYLAYTQQSFWQAYNKSAFFRANNYQPEVFLENNVYLPLWCGWSLQLLNVGLVHQSNGRGGFLERSWNRGYVEAIFSKDAWLVSLRPWIVLCEGSLKQHNPDIQRYLGHGRILISHRFEQQVISLICYNTIESGFRRGSYQLSYSFPFPYIDKIRGYVQVFKGYGQTLIEYNHKTTAIGIGLSFSDWL